MKSLRREWEEVGKAKSRERTQRKERGRGKRGRAFDSLLECELEEGEDPLLAFPVDLRIS